MPAVDGRRAARERERALGRLADMGPDGARGRCDPQAAAVRDRVGHDRRRGRPGRRTGRRRHAVLRAAQVLPPARRRRGRAPSGLSVHAARRPPCGDAARDRRDDARDARRLRDRLAQRARRPARRGRVRPRRLRVHARTLHRRRGRKRAARDGGLPGDGARARGRRAACGARRPRRERRAARRPDRHALAPDARRPLRARTRPRLVPLRGDRRRAAAVCGRGAARLSGLHPARGDRRRTSAAARVAREPLLGRVDDGRSRVRRALHARDERIRRGARHDRALFPRHDSRDLPRAAARARPLVDRQPPRRAGATHAHRALHDRRRPRRHCRRRPDARGARTMQRGARRRARAHHRAGLRSLRPLSRPALAALDPSGARRVLDARRAPSPSTESRIEPRTAPRDELPRAARAHAACGRSTNAHAPLATPIRSSA